MSFKLVRDNQREWCEANGVSGTWTHVSGYPLIDALERKLHEELGEYTEHCDPAELFDVQDVLNRMIRLLDPDGYYFDAHMEKTEEHGFYNDGLMWSPLPGDTP